MVSVPIIVRLWAASAAGGQRSVRLLPAGAAHIAHARTYCAGLGGALRLDLAGGKRIVADVLEVLRFIAAQRRLGGWLSFA